MVTDRYQHVRHHPDRASLTAWAAAEDLPIIGIDNAGAAAAIAMHAWVQRYAEIPHP